jgi:16S rRNA A1518/A1519 N6-dimethyltransferase RsmA/KsgA/DIM1 with predicted DNA glycosylase/AP lyase activity
LKTLNWSPWYEFSTGLELPAEAFHPKPEVGACLMVAVKRDPPIIDHHSRHLFRAFAHKAFEGHGNSVRKALRPFFTNTQLRWLARDNGFSLECTPSMLTVHQWASVFDSMIRMVPRARWPSTRQHSRRDSQQR